MQFFTDTKELTVMEKKLQNPCRVFTKGNGNVQKVLVSTVL